MNTKKQLSLISVAVLSAILTGCGDAETTINEREPIVEQPTTPDAGGDTSGDILIESMGRLAVQSESSLSVTVFDLDDNAMLDSFALTNEGSRIYPSSNYRFASIVARDAGSVDFIDGGLWREDHVAHLHDYEQAPEMSSYALAGARPTHVTSFEGQTAVFYDGSSDGSQPASVEVVTDTDIAGGNTALPALNYTVNMHGVAKPLGDMLISTVRRDDEESTSLIKVLPDQVGAYHLHDGEYELEHVFEHTCPDLHGAGQNEEYVVFGCSDGVLVTHAHEEEFESAKIENIPALDGIRIGTVYGHKESGLFLGVASNRATGEVVLVGIDPAAGSMEVVEWQAQNEATPSSYAFSYGGDHLVILDNQGFISKYEVHTHDGALAFELDEQLDISEQDVTTMPEGHSFTMTMAQNSDHLYVADPIAQHVLQIDIDSMTITGDIETDVVPSNVIWLGIKEAEHGHDH